MPHSKALVNRILDRLPPEDHKRIVGQMERITPALGEVIAQPGVPPKWVHFPISAVLSSMVVLEDGDTVEGSTLGNEGMDGLYLLSAALVNPCKINVQVEGEILRMSAAAFKKTLADSPAMTDLLMRYAFVGPGWRRRPASASESPPRCTSRRCDCRIRQNRTAETKRETPILGSKSGR
jgi:hypothetical protein